MLKREMLKSEDIDPENEQVAPEVTCFRSGQPDVLLRHVKAKLNNADTLLEESTVWKEMEQPQMDLVLQPVVADLVEMPRSAQQVL